MSKSEKKTKEEPKEHAPDVPIDPATGEPHKSGEVPLGKNEPLP